MSYIDPRKSYNYFVSNFSLKSTTNGWFLFDCPFCDGWNKLTGNVHFLGGVAKCFRCSYKGGIIDFAAQYENLDYADAREMLWRVEPLKITLEDLGKIESDSFKLGDAEVTLPEGFTSILSGTGALAKRARNYLAGRGFDLDELDQEGYGYCNKHYTEDEDPKDNFLKDFYGYIIVPFRRAGKLRYYLGRNFLGDDFMRYKNPPKEFVGVGKSEVVFNEQALLLYKEVFITEGWSDAKTIGKKGTATLGWSMSPTQKSMYYNSQVKRLVWLPDVGIDQATGLSYYQVATKAAMEFLDSGKEIFVVELDHLQTGKDVNAIGKELVMNEYRNNTPRLTLGGAMKILTRKNIPYVS